MANKKIEIDIEVKNKGLKDAADQAEKLKGSLKQLNQNLAIQYSIDGRPIDVVIDKSLNLQKQVKILTAELRKTKEGTAEFKLLSNRLGEAQDGLARVNAKSKDLFTTLSTLPGPVGDFFAQLQGSIELLKTLSSFTLKDIAFQFKETADDIGDIGKNISGINISVVSDGLQEVATEATSTAAAQKVLKEETSDLNKALKDGTVNYATTVAANKSLQNSVNSSTQAISKMATSIPTAAVAFRNLDVEQIKVLQTLSILEDKNRTDLIGIENRTVKIKQLNGALRSLEPAELALIKSGQALTVTQDRQIVASTKLTLIQKIQTTVTKGLAAAMVALGVAEETAAAAALTLTRALAATGILALVAAIGYGIYKLVEFAEAFNKISDETKAATKAVTDFRIKQHDMTNSIRLAKEGLKSKKEVLDEYNNTLGASVGYAGSLNQAEQLMASNTGIVLESIRLRAMAQTLYAKAAEEVAKQVTGEGMKPTFWQASLIAIKNLGSSTGIARDLMKKYGENVDESKKKVSALTKESEKLELQAIENDKKKRKGLAEKPKDGSGADLAAQLREKEYQRLQSDLDARIQLEINKEKTSRKELEGLLNLKRELLTKHDKLTFNQVELLRQEHYKKTNDAIIEDNTRVIQAEIDKNTRLVIEAGVGTEKLFKEKRAVAHAEYLKEIEEANKDEFTKATKLENARTNYWKKLMDIDKEALTAIQLQAQLAFSNEYEGTVTFYDKQRELELANYALKQADARDNYEKLEELKREHIKNIVAIDVAEIRNIADLEGRKANVEMERFDTIEDRFFKSFNVITQLEERKYQDLREQEGLNYIASVKAAGDNTKAVEVIEMEHAQKMRQIDADEYEAKKQTQLMVVEATAQMGQQLAQIGDAIMQASAGRDEAMFKAGKAAAVAGIAIEKASAIVAIWTNTAIANAKAVAAFPLTLGQPWVTINTVSAAVSTAATIAAAALAIGQINGTQFNSGGSGAKGNQLGRNYADGGMIGGNRHADGGTMIEAEKGEAIMTRGAVAMFGPVLSMLNQAGGGTSFSQGAVGASNYDSPKASNQSQDSSPMIVKTYVVANEMQSEAHKQNRLKDLSTL